MRAVVLEGYGSADKLKFVQDFPEPGPPIKHEVKIRVHAAAANAADYKVREGYVQSFMKLAPFPLVLGADCAGTVVAVGPKVKSVKVGDEVYGQTALVQRGKDGSHAEYAVVYDTNWELALKPSSMSFEEAASLPCAGITALACLRSYGKLKRGERVFVLGGSGGVGHFAIQLAKALGASFIAATCSSKNMEMVMGFGADVVYDYNATKEELALAEAKPDLIIDCVRGPEAWKAVLQARLPATTRFVTVIGEFGDAAVGLGGLVKFMSLIAWRGLRHSLGVAPAYLMVLGQEKENLGDLNALFEDKKLRPHIDRVVPLEKVKEVHELLQSHRARGKIVIKM